MPPSSTDADPPPRLEDLLVQHADWLRDRVRRRAGWLLRVDGLDDLVQDVRLRALGAEASFAYQGEGQLKAWLDRAVSQHLADRRRYWGASRRDAGPMLRVSGVGSPSTIAGRGVDPADGGPGPRTWAEARDQHAFAMRAVDALLPRDQRLIEWIREGRADDWIAAELDLSPEAAARARQRAVERFRQAYELLVRAGV